MNKQQGESINERGATPAGVRDAAPRRAATRLQTRRAGRGWGRLVINAFILWQLFALTIWLLPASELRQSCVGLVQPYMAFTGLTQRWAMFSPNPDDVDAYIEARIIYADRHVRRWIYPRMIDMG